MPIFKLVSHLSFQNDSYCALRSPGNLFCLYIILQNEILHFLDGNIYDIDLTMMFFC